MKLNPVEAVPHDEWKTKPSDRLSSNGSRSIFPRVLPLELINLQWLRPWMITVLSTTTGVFAGVVFALGCGWIAGCLAALAQVLDGVDGQFVGGLPACRAGGGAFLDSVLDRYFDTALTIGLVVYLIEFLPDCPSRCCWQWRFLRFPAAASLAIPPPGLKVSGLRWGSRRWQARGQGQA